MVLLGAFQEVLYLLVREYPTLFLRYCFFEFHPFVRIIVYFQPNLSVPELLIQLHLLHEHIDEPPSLVFDWSHDILAHPFIFFSLLSPEGSQLLKNVPGFVLPEVDVAMGIGSSVGPVSRLLKLRDFCCWFLWRCTSGWDDSWRLLALKTCNGSHPILLRPLYPLLDIHHLILKVLAHILFLVLVQRCIQKQLITTVHQPGILLNTSMGEQMSPLPFLPFLRPSRQHGPQPAMLYRLSHPGFLTEPIILVIDPIQNILDLLIDRIDRVYSQIILDSFGVIVA